MSRRDKRNTVRIVAVALLIGTILLSGCASIDESMRKDGGTGLPWWGSLLIWLGGLLVPAAGLAGSHELTKTATHRDTSGSVIGTTEVGTGQFSEPMPVLGLIWIVGYVGYWLFYGWWH